MTNSLETKLAKILLKYNLDSELLLRELINFFDDLEGEAYSRGYDSALDWADYSNEMDIDH